MRPFCSPPLSALVTSLLCQAALAQAPSDPADPTANNWWSFQPLQSPATPNVQNPNWARTELDRFVLADRESRGLPAPEPVSALELARRARFDLTGLPPTLAEVEALEREPTHFQAWAEELLASPQFGEHFARHWLDVVRYGEDDPRPMAGDESGAEKYPSAFTYRDWVINAFRRDLPWDQFIRAQLAGDLLAEAERAQAIGGTGMLGAGPWFYDNAESAIVRAEEVADRVDVVSRGFLGLSLACARCHDHKYDPLTARDYTALAGVFENTEFHAYPLDPKQVDRARKHREELRALQDQLREFLQTERDQLARARSLQIADYVVAAWRVCGQPHGKVERVAARAQLDLETLQRWIRFLSDPAKTHTALFPWRKLVASDADEEGKARAIAEELQRQLLDLVRRQSQIRERNEKTLAREVPDDEDRPRRQLPNGYVAFLDQASLVLDALEPDDWKLWYEIYRWDLDDDSEEGTRGVLAAADWSLERQLSSAAKGHTTHLRARIEALQKETAEPAIVHMGIRTVEPERVLETRVHVRGDPRRLGDPVSRQFIKVLQQGKSRPFASTDGRLELAECIATHPLSDRVIVNRIWQWLFGTGLVDTPDDFGVRGSAPRNPALLEYLAHWFHQNGRSVKTLVRLIVSSSTYASRTELRPPRTLDAESLRDAMLAISGRLDQTVGGPSFELSDAEANRRTVYGRVSRYSLDSYLATFDFPDPRIPSHCRISTEVPQQALFLQNSRMVGVCVESLWAELQNIQSQEELLRVAIERTHSRAPLPGEVPRCLDYLHAGEDIPGGAEADKASFSAEVVGQRLLRALLSSREFRQLH